jgi:hypothetical protein
MVPTCGPDRSVGESEKKGGAGRCELLGHGLLRGPRGESAGPQARTREREGRPAACLGLCGPRRLGGPGRKKKK